MKVNVSFALFNRTQNALWRLMFHLLYLIAHKMVHPLEEYQKMSSAQRKSFKHAELQAILDEQVDDDVNVNTLRGIIREELNVYFKELENKLLAKCNVKFKELTTENDKLRNENLKSLVNIFGICTMGKIK